MLNWIWPSKRNLGIGILTGAVVGLVSAITGLGITTTIIASALLTLGLLLAVGE